jgi:hypothetical protein
MKEARHRKLYMAQFPLYEMSRKYKAIDRKQIGSWLRWEQVLTVKELLSMPRQENCLSLGVLDQPGQQSENPSSKEKKFLSPMGERM